MASKSNEKNLFVIIYFQCHDLYGVWKLIRQNDIEKSNCNFLFLIQKLKLNRIIDRFLEKYPDYDNETITVFNHDINSALNYPKPFRSLFVIFEYFLNKISKPLLIIDHLDTTYWDLAEMCRHLDDRSVLKDVIDKVARYTIQINKFQKKILILK